MFVLTLFVFYMQQVSLPRPSTAEFILAYNGVADRLGKVAVAVGFFFSWMVYYIAGRGYVAVAGFLTTAYVGWCGFDWAWVLELLDRVVGYANNVFK
jgi:hypothetical protein